MHVVALFSWDFFLALPTVAFSFVFYIYYRIMDYLDSKDLSRKL